MQCGREYGFGKQNDKVRATEISKLTSEERKDLDRNNVICENELGVFDHRSVVSKSRNRKFKAKSLRNDMVLHRASLTNTSTKISVSVAKLLSQRESVWNEEQMQLHRLKVEEKMKKAQSASNYTNKLLQSCKNWGGPVVSSEELKDILEARPQIQEQIVRTELAYYRDTHRADVIANPDLFKLNKVTHEERLINICVLLNGSPLTKALPLPSNIDALKTLQPSENQVIEDVIDEPLITVNQICIALWIENGTRNWYVGYCKEVKENDTYVIEHLERVRRGCNLKWRYPTTEDIQVVEGDQLLDCEINGDWDVLADRNMCFTLQNHKFIDEKFVELI